MTKSVQLAADDYLVLGSILNDEHGEYARIDEVSTNIEGFVIDVTDAVFMNNELTIYLEELIMEAGQPLGESVQ